jgi:hypothetical protein
MSTKKYWFANKKYGWGWKPISWEGWLVLTIFTVVLLLGAKLLVNYSIIVSTIAFIVWCTLLVLITVKKGVKPEVDGDDEDDEI